MYSCLNWIKKVIARCLILIRFGRHQTHDQAYQLQQFANNSENTGRDGESTLKVELRKNSYQDESFIQHNDTKVDFHEFEIENKANFQDCEQQLQPDYQDTDIQTFISTTPFVELADLENMREIGDKSLQCFQQVVDRLDGYELLEDNQDEFSFWIKYVETPEKFQISLMRYTYTLNTTLDNYLAFIKDLEVQKTLDNSIDAFEAHYQSEEMQLNYLRYKRILFMDPRDFLYVKRIDRKDENNCIEISKSIQIEGFQPKIPSTKSTTRALLLLSGNLIQQIEDNKLLITTYSECNMKLKLKPVMLKASSKNEIKKIVKKYRDHFNQN